MSRIGTGLGMVFLAAAACDRSPASQGGPAGRLDVRWTGADTGTLSAPATAEWCGVLRMLEIQAVRGDTGVALALYPKDTSIAPGQYPVVDPMKAESIPPAAGAALRLAGETSIRGFQSETGTVVLQRAGSGDLSGSLTAAARSVTDTGRISLTGTFQNLRVRPPGRGCVPRLEDPNKDAQPRDTHVH